MVAGLALSSGPAFLTQKLRIKPCSSPSLPAPELGSLGQVTPSPSLSALVSNAGHKGMARSRLQSTHTAGPWEALPRSLSRKEWLSGRGVRIDPCVRPSPIPTSKNTPSVLPVA